jgi:nucleoside-diphosphate-sugar epimerase
MQLPHPAIADTLRGKHLFVTGATGFVGKVWLGHLLAHAPEIGRITLLVRGNRKQSAAARMADMLDRSPAMRPLREALGADWSTFLAQRVRVVDGDVARPDCGLDEATLAALADSVDATVHIAGLTDFQPDPRKGVPANVHGASHVADVAARCRGARLLHVSTCFVAGTEGGRAREALTPGVSPLGVRFDPAEELAALDALNREIATAPERIDAAVARARHLGWPNLYTFTKGLAEHSLTARDDLALTIVRPSVVECARTWPFPGWNEGLNTSAPIMWFCGTPFLHLPSAAAHHFDIVPVDAVARAMSVALARLLEGRAQPIYQVATSDHNPATFERIVELTALGKRRHAGRGGATLRERVEAHLDVAPRHHDEGQPLSPETAERLFGRLTRALTSLEDRDAWPWPLRPVADHLRPRVTEQRRALVRARRKMGQLKQMLDVYRPFLHDHDWIFESGALRAEQATLTPADAAFADDLSTMCWRSYWLDVQYPGVLKWSFPIMDGLEAPLDPPSDPPLVLHAADRLQGAA